MDGVLIIDKPAGITSHDVVARVRRVLKTKRVGHTGTLDPFATGVMVLLIGRATRLAKFLDKDVKEYEAVIRFGTETDTGDRTGIPRAGSGMGNEEICSLINNADWDAVLSGFRGEIDQTPPMYSAKKLEGKKMYELARKGIEVEREPKKVTVFDLDVLNDAGSPCTVPEVTVRVVCSAGTYIRTLAEDIGRRLGPGAHLTQLRRTRAGKFDIASAISLDGLEEMGRPADRILPIEDAVEHLPELTLPDERVAKTRNGLPTRVPDGSYEDGQAVRMVSVREGLTAIGYYDAADSIVRPKVVLV